MCKDYNSLPSAGGVYDQDYQEMRTMRILSNVYDTITYLRGLQGHDIHRLHPQQRRIIRFLLDHKLWQM